MADQGFGKFKSVGALLESYKAAQEREVTEAEKETPFEEWVREEAADPERRRDRRGPASSRAGRH